jgi:cytosine/adenosine deaminase-related metal-dependent hydrolase
MILHGARVAMNARESGELDIEIAAEKILAIRKPQQRRYSARSLDLSGHIIVPGLINAHDHLEFNLYPRLGRGPYPDARAWARDIYHPLESPVKEQLQIPKSTRLLWGGLKNLLSGVTTVCHHNPYDRAVFDHNFPVRVMSRFGWAHSLDFSPDVAERFQATPPEWPFILHLGEGTNREAANEIFTLDKLGVLCERTVLVHAVALDLKGLRLLAGKGASLIWCPSSNIFLLDRTLSAETLHSGIPVALGSDSALTAKGDLLDEMKLARKLSDLASHEIYNLVTVGAASILRLQNGEGTLAVGQAADLVAFPGETKTPAAAVMRARSPALTMVGGKIKLMSPALASQGRQQANLDRLEIEGRGEFFVAANIPKLRASAGRVLGTDLRLAGRRIIA